MSKLEAFSGAERVKDFKPKAFDGNPQIFYRQDGRWEQGQLSDRPTTDGKVIKIKLRGTIAEISLNTPPIRIERVIGAPVSYEGKDYAILAIKPDANGNVLYDLQEVAPATGLPVLPLQFKYHVEQEAIGTAEKLADFKTAGASLETSLATKITGLLVEVKKLKGEQRSALMTKVVGLEKAVKELNVQIAKAGAETASVAVKVIEDKIEEIKNKIDTEGEALEKEVKKAVDDELNDKKRHGLAVAVAKRLDNKIKTEDNAELARYSREKKDFDDVKQLHDDWQKKLEEETERAKQASPTDKQAQARAVNAWKVANVEPPKPPKKEPVLNKPSENDLEKRKWIIEIFNGLAPVDFSDFTAEVTKLRQEEAKAALKVKTPATGTAPAVYDYDDVADKDAYERITREQFEKVIADWSAKNDKEIKFDFKTEKKALETQARVLITSADAKGELVLATVVKGILKGTGTPPSGGIEQLLATTPNVDQAMIDIMRKLGEQEVALFEAEQETTLPAPAKRESAKESTVDLPPEIYAEMFAQNMPKVQEIMEAAFDTVHGTGKTNATLETKLREFFRGIDVQRLSPASSTTTLRERLLALGVPNWESFLKRFESKIAEKMANVFVVMVKAETASWESQNLTTIKKDGRATKQEKRDTAVWRQMKGAVATRLAANTVILGTTGVLASVAGSVLFAGDISGQTKATFVGGAVGLAKSLSQWAFGKSDKLQQAAEEAKKKADNAKRRIIATELSKRFFRASTATPTGPPSFELGKEAVLSAIFSDVVREVTAEGDDKEMTIKDEAGNNPIILKGDAVCMYHEALKRAALDQGIENSDELKTKYAFAKAIFALRNNDKIAIQDTPPWLVDKLQKYVVDPFTGRTAFVTGLKKGDPVHLAQQALVTTAIGAAVGYAMFGNNDYGRAIVGGSMGFVAGAKAKSDKQRAAADMAARPELQWALEILQNSLSNSARTPNQIKEWRDLLAAILNGKRVKEEMFPALLADPSEARILRYFATHAEDVTSLLGRDQSMLRFAKSVQREISRSGILEQENGRRDFMAALTAIQKVGDKLENDAKNSAGVEFGRSRERILVGIGYGLASGATAYLAGAGIHAARRAIWHDQPVASDIVGPPRPDFVGPPRPDIITVAPPASGAASTPEAVRSSVAKHYDIISPGTVPGNPTEHLKVMVAGIMREKISGDSALTTTEAQNLDTTAADLRIIGSTGRHLDLHKGLDANEAKELDGLMKDRNNIFAVRKDSFEIKTPDTFRRLAELVYKHAEELHKGGEKFGSQAVGHEQWSEVQKAAGVEKVDVHKFAPVYPAHPSTPVADGLHGDLPGHPIASGVDHPFGTPDLEPPFPLAGTDIVAPLFSSGSRPGAPLAWGGSGADSAALSRGAGVGDSSLRSGSRLGTLLGGLMEQARQSSGHPAAGAADGHPSTAFAAAAEAPVTLGADHPIIFKGSHIEFLDGSGHSHKFDLGPGYSVAAGDDAQHLKITLPGATETIQVRLLPSVDGKGVVLAHTEFKPGYQDPRLKDAGVANEQIDKTWEVKGRQLKEVSAPVAAEGASVSVLSPTEQRPIMSLPSVDGKKHFQIWDSTKHAPANDFVLDGKYRPTLAKDGQTVDLTVDGKKFHGTFAVRPFGEGPVKVPGPAFVVPAGGKGFSDVERIFPVKGDGTLGTMQKENVLPGIIRKLAA